MGGVRITKRRDYSPERRSLSFAKSRRMSRATSSTSCGTRGSSPISHANAVVSGNKRLAAGEDRISSCSVRARDRHWHNQAVEDCPRERAKLRKDCEKRFEVLLASGRFTDCEIACARIRRPRHRFSSDFMPHRSSNRSAVPIADLYCRSASSRSAFSRSTSSASTRGLAGSLSSNRNTASSQVSRASRGRSSIRSVSPLPKRAIATWIAKDRRSPVPNRCITCSGGQGFLRPIQFSDNRPLKNRVFATSARTASVSLSPEPMHESRRRHPVPSPADSARRV